MIPYKSSVLLTVPPTLEKRLEVLEAIRTVATQEDEAIRQRRAEIAELRRIHGKLVLEIQEMHQALDPRLRSYVMWREGDEANTSAANSVARPDRQAPIAVLKASPDDAEHPGWPAGTPDGKGGKFRPKDGEAGATQSASRSDAHTTASDVDSVNATARRLNFAVVSGTYEKCLDLCFPLLERFQAPGSDRNKWDFHKCMNACLGR